jgi:hypothetical protein
MKGFLLIVLLFYNGVFVFSQAECQSADYRMDLLRNSPATAARAGAIESFIKHRLETQKAETKKPDSSLESKIIQIPVLVHIVYQTDAENISDAQVNSQIDVLNRDYLRLNPDTGNAPLNFREVAANCGIQFALARTDSLGNATTGILRRQTHIEAFSITDEIKFSSKGGDDAWNPDNYLNIWVGNLTSGILGYSSVVGGPPDRDGVVIGYTAFGTMGTVTAPFNGGRTATHEIGHWLNLIHPWGDADCGDDHVDDTPPQETADRGCPEGIRISCQNGPNGDMYMNFMDFTNDNCMNLFTQGQRARMLALFAPGGPRHPLLFSTSLMASSQPPASSSVAADGGNAFRVYPNPASDRIRIEWPVAQPQDSRLEIYNEMGQRIRVFDILRQEQQFPVSSLGKGIYFIHLINGSSRKVAKLVKF